MTTWNESLWRQLGAAIDMLENAIVACPEELWLDSARRPWHLAYHTLFFLDLYLSGTVEGFAPPPPFTLSELDPAGVLPERAYKKAEMLAYLDHGRRKCRTTLAALDEETVRRPAAFPWLPGFTIGELHLCSLRHVQHGAAQLNLLLRQTVDDAPAWVKRAKESIEADGRSTGSIPPEGSAPSTRADPGPLGTPPDRAEQADPACGNRPDQRERGDFCRETCPDRRERVDLLPQTRPDQRE